MITILSWNIQNGQGVDGIVSLERIAKVVSSICSPDIICFQEVSRNCELKDGTQPDQVEHLSDLFKGYLPFFGPAYDILRDGKKNREQFGNLILSRLPVSSFFNHILPQPTTSSIKQMPRQVTEITIQTPLFPLCVMTTHLEFNSKEQRSEQVNRILSINNDINELSKFPPSNTKGIFAKIERSNRVLICGDFNFTPDSSEYELLTMKSGNTAPLIDAWKTINPNTKHSPTCGIFDNEIWPQGPHCRDFAFVSENLKSNIESMDVNEETDASDHQPFVISIST